MGRKPVPQPLALADSMRPGEDPRVGETVLNSAPPDTTSPRSPRSPFRFGQKKSESAAGLQALQVTEVLQQQQRQIQQRTNPPPDNYPYSPSITSPVEQPFPPRDHSPATSQQRGRKHQRYDDDKASKSGFFFQFGKSNKSTDRLNTYQTTDPRGETMSRDSDHPALSKQSTKQSDSSYPDQSGQKNPIPTLPSKSDLSLASSTDYDNAATSKKGKPKPFTLLSRTRSIKERDNKDSPSPKDSAPSTARIAEPERERAYAAAPMPLRTAPIQAHDRSFREMMSSAVRNHSAERSQVRDISGSNRRDTDSNSRYQPSSYKENSGSTFLSGLKNSKAAGILSKGFFGGSGRGDAGSHREPVVDDEHYVLKVINLPLVEQTRKTRISKRLEDSRDKTEFWMPAFPWRAIDYLNYKGSDVEGLYRVPGSGPQIKRWQRKFDEELDVDLFEQSDLYDINIIGSMLKAWLRELPDELFPKAAQDRIARECAGSDTVPQLLIDELSNLSPFNYYLLFAITCHLSLLLAHSDKNKMDFRNLCICFQPCMKIDAFCFKFLVCDWRDCWKGCKNEAKFIEEEYARFDQPPPSGAVIPPRRNGTGNGNGNGSSSGSGSGNGNGDPSNGNTAQEVQEERNVSSSDSSKNSNRSEKGRLRKKAVPEPESAETSSTISTTLTISSETETPPRRSGDPLRPLSPIKPLSPLGF
ncbi:hypothetical protein B0T25DRAFT_350113 [Lasiosphaeria hispida]|uniref:Rho-GAP domain-containing protein n=1 Tax=Lasiosphaeria hispida TaxID=260671 RepID=A0AAJ0M8H7_9PEZI|nr:hypothetical protein B0T25DRAFT_350113 [Lasiosphaeria hispida]